jgi:hypothetical protein
MLKTLLLSSFLTLAALVTGCGAPSLNPLYADASETVKDDRIVGTWVKKDAKGDEAAKSTFTVAAAGAKDGDEAKGGYIVSIKAEDGTMASWVVHLVKLDSALFVDVTATEDSAKKVMERNLGTFLPVHQIGRMTVSDKEMSLGLLDITALKDLLKATPKALAHSMQKDGTPVVTASTPDLRTFCKSKAKDEKLFGTADVYVKADGKK